MSIILKIYIKKPSNAKWAVWKRKKVEWMNAYNDYNMAIIRLMDEEIEAYTEKKKYKKQR